MVAGTRKEEGKNSYLRVVFKTALPLADATALASPHLTAYKHRHGGGMRSASDTTCILHSRNLLSHRLSSQQPLSAFSHYWWNMVAPH